MRFQPFLLLAVVIFACNGPAPGPAVREVAVFREVGAEVGLDFVHDNRMAGDFYFPEIMGSGAAFVDYDGDGDLDLYLVQGGELLGPGSGAPPRPEAPPGDRLFRNDSAGNGGGRLPMRLIDVSEGAGIGAPAAGFGVAVGDVDNDGWPDLYVTRYGPNVVWRNLGDGTFEELEEASGTGDSLWGISAAFADYDSDGWLDLYVANYVDFDAHTHEICPSPSGEPDYCGPVTFQPEPDRLYRNRGDGTFEDVSVTSGVALVSGSGLGVVATDYDGDGLLDFFVANDKMANFLWRNRGDGSFVDAALEEGCAVDGDGQAEAGMGVDAADVDGDGDEDLVLGHFDGETNTLYANQGGWFLDASLASGLGPPSRPFTAFGTAWLDFDNDGWLDLVAVNGRVDRAPGADLGAFPFTERDQLFRNLGGGRFEEISAGGGLDREAVSRGLAVGDFDNDGDPDLLVMHVADRADLLRNEHPHGGHWLGLEPLGAGGRDALGTRVVLETDDGAVLVRRTGTDGSYASARDPRVLFGLGPSGSIRSLEVTWPGGGGLRILGPAADRYYVLRQHDG